MMDGIAKGKELGLGPKSRKHVFAAARRVFSAAVEQGIVGSNPCSKVKGPRVSTKVKADVCIWTAEEAKRFLHAAKDHRLFPLLWLLLNTGMRRGEALALTVDDFSVKSGQLRVMRNVIQDEKGRPHLEDSTKTAAGMRYVDLTPQTLLCPDRVGWSIGTPQSRALSYGDSLLPECSSNGKPDAER